MIVLDTHIFVWLNQNDPRLTNYHRQVIEKEREYGLGISTISLIEIARLVSAERIILPLPIQEWFEIALSQEGIILISITPAIAVEAQTLPGDFHKDPADRIIVATARVSNISVVTVDKKILDYSFVKTIAPNIS
ncbi:type II toxin-antitoxin system VapC family toxin [Pleurocapsa sp. FMAR1]|uniref:type II toxin-antitoxin system VapC family toxin n=1 Tax=Pleurocapsa sp. FMAR1 TaxID=3040204 RepID=UPI0029C967F8|nr:type II toxin-antitoxin system VapC family toxin [Pleurocapsa sp. FMAR1]